MPDEVSTFKLNVAGVQALLERAERILGAGDNIGPAEEAALIALGLYELNRAPETRPDLARLAIPVLARSAASQKALELGLLDEFGGHRSRGLRCQRPNLP